jgi:hypothetical protein
VDTVDYFAANISDEPCGTARIFANNEAKRLEQFQHGRASRRRARGFLPRTHDGNIPQAPHELAPACLCACQLNAPKLASPGAEVRLSKCIWRESLSDFPGGAGLSPLLGAYFPFFRASDARHIHFAGDFPKANTCCIPVLICCQTSMEMERRIITSYHNFRYPSHTRLPAVWPMRSAIRAGKSSGAARINLRNRFQR